MKTMQWYDENYDDEDFIVFSYFELKKCYKKRKRRDTKMMKQQQRLKKELPATDEYGSYSY
jgi:hypothetical protein